MDQIAEEYAGKAVVFLEYSVDGGFYTRLSRWWTAFDGTSATLPLIMVDSGQKISNGPVNFYNEYTGMVDAALTRPPQADIEAYVWRDGNKVIFYAAVQNFSGNSLDYYSNSAALHGIVYEDIHAGVTNRYVRSAVVTMILNLEPNETSTYLFETPDLSGVDWSKLHFIVLADYIPPGQEIYDMLQADRAELIYNAFDVLPSVLPIDIDPDHPYDTSRRLSLQGAGFISWSAAEETAWFSVAPAGGTMDDPPVVTVDAALLSPGVQYGTIIFTTMDGLFRKEVTVKAYYGPVLHTFAPFIRR